MSEDATEEGEGRAPVKRLGAEDPPRSVAARKGGDSLPIIHLGIEEKPLSVAEQIALAELNIRKDMARRIVAIFIVANVVVLAGIGCFFGFDVALIRGNMLQPDQRLITTEVVMTVIGATTVQLGAVMYTIARYVFPTRDAGGSDTTTS